MIEPTQADQIMNFVQSSGGVGGLGLTGIALYRIVKLEARFEVLADRLGVPKPPKRPRGGLGLFLCLMACVLSMWFLSGCKTGEAGSRDAERIAGVVKVAAYVGTSEGLRAHPEWRLGFEMARTELAALEANTNLDFAVVLSIVNRLPVKELKSSRAVLLITSGTILLQEVGSGPLSLDTTKIQPIVKALREGVDLGLAQSENSAAVQPLPSGLFLGPANAPKLWSFKNVDGTVVIPI